MSIDLKVLHLVFTATVQSPIHLGPQAGGQIRGAFWAALRQFACTDPATGDRVQHSQHCPMCRLVALETEDGTRGAMPPRPFAVRPPLAVHPGQDRIFDRGEAFSFGLSLFGDARDLLVYVCQAVYRMGEIGIGYGRGRFRLESVEALNWLTGESEELLDSGMQLTLPQVIMTPQQVAEKCTQLSATQIRLRFLTPTMLKHAKSVQTQPMMSILIARLLERCQSLETFYTPHPQTTECWRERHRYLTEHAQGIQANYATHWVQVESGSRRTMQRTSMGGFVGDASYRGDLSPLLPWLVWGELLHVGKNVVKGAGWYSIV